MSFVHLHSHTSYSLLDGAGRIKKMVNEAANLGMNSLAITDHGNMYGSLEFYTAAKQAGIKPIIGCEAYIAPDDRRIQRQIEGESHSYHLVLLAKNETGYKNLIKLTSMAYLEGFYYRPRIDKELLSQHSEGLIALSACMKGEIAWKLSRNRRQDAIKIAEYYIETFGDDFYFEIQDHSIPEEHTTYPLVYDLAKEMHVPVVATNDVHYLHKKDYQAHDILICLQTGKDRDDPNRMRYNTTELYMKSPEEMYKLFKDRPDVVERTLEVAEKINLELDFNKRLLPEFPIPENEGTKDPNEYLEKIARNGIDRKYKNKTPDIEKRLEYELGIIQKMGFAGYFLIVQDFINAARERDIPVGLGRGSAAGSIVAYSLGITDVDPIKYDLLFERFLNPERVTMPDIDIDFCFERREEVIEYVREKYGKRNVAQIITFGTMGAKSAIKDVARVLKVPLSRADQIAKQIPMEGAKPMALEKAFSTVKELKELTESSDPLINELTEYSQTLEGLSRHTSVHAAGVIIAPEDITNFAPLCVSSDKEITTQWTMSWCEAIGLLKMDFLGLRNLTVIHNAEVMIREKHDPDFSIEKIPLDDPKTYELFGAGNTVGVFQFESSGMQEYLRKLHPNRVEDLIAMNALYRPGPMQFIDDFIDRKQGRKQIVYAHPKLEPILKETYGIIVYQEQVMRITSELGGFTLAEADIMRRIMGKKKIEDMIAQKEKFVKGAMENGIQKSVAQQIADMIQEFAKYGFNKSHAAAYALIAYQTGYLKSNYPAEFMAANLSSEVNNSDKVVILMDECRNMGISVVPPDVNHSVAKFVPIEEKKIAFGMAAIKNVGTGAIESIIEQRKNLGKFTSLFQMMQYVDLRQVNKKVLESLAQCGALDSLSGNRAQKFHAIESAIEFGQDFQNIEKRNSGQKSLFDSGDVKDSLITHPKLPDIPDWPAQEKLKKEKEFLGFYISGHPLQKYEAIVKLYASDLKKIVETENEEKKQEEKANGNGRFHNNGGLKISLCGIVSEISARPDSKGNMMAWVKLEDFEATHEAVIFSSVYQNYSELIKADAMLMIRGKMDSGGARSGGMKILANEIFTLDSVPSKLTEALYLRIEKDKFSEREIDYLNNLLRTHPGQLPVFVQIAMSGNENYRTRASSVKINVDGALLNELAKLLTLNNVKVKVKK